MIYRKLVNLTIIFVVLSLVYVVMREIIVPVPSIEHLNEYANNFEPRKGVVELENGGRYGYCYLVENEDIPNPVKDILRRHDKTDFNFRKSIVLIFLKQYRCDVLYTGVGSSYDGDLWDRIFKKNLLYSAYLEILGDLVSENVLTTDVLEMLAMDDNIRKSIEVQEMLKEIYKVYISRDIGSDFPNKMIENSGD